MTMETELQAMFRPLNEKQRDYALHCLSSWHGWRDDQTAFVFPSHEVKRWVLGQCRKAVRKALQNA